MNKKSENVLLANDFTVRIVEIASSANEFDSANAS
jgi:hypothetical protein